MVSCRTSDLQCAHVISKYGAPLSKAVGPSGPRGCFFFSCEKKSHFNRKYSSHSESTDSIIS